MRFYISFGVHRFSYPFGNDDKDVAWVNDFIKRTLDTFKFGRVILFENLEQEDDFKKSFSKDHNIMKIEDLFY